MNPRSSRAPALSTGSLTDLLLAGLLAAIAAAGLLWAGAAVATLAVSGHLPDGRLSDALVALGHVRRPAAAWPPGSGVPGPVPYWLCTALVLCLAGAIGLGGWQLGRRLSGRGPADRAHITALPGLAGPREVAHVADRRALLARAPVVRPSLDPRGNGRRALEPASVGYRLGRVRGRELWFSVEDSVVVVGPPRTGKGLHLVVPWVLDAPGPVVSTSTRPDTLAVTLAARQRVGPTAVFDPQGLAGLPGGLRWSPVRGCDLPRTAMVRARGLAAGAGWARGTVSDGDFWAGQTEAALRCLLHAAALDGRGPLDLYRWSLNPAGAEDAVTVLTRHPGAARGWADALEAQVHADPRTRDSVWLGVRAALGGLADPDVLAAVDPGPEDGFDPGAFLRDSGTLYLLATSTGAGACAPLVAAFVEDVTETARSIAARSPHARCDPPLLLALDEIANLTPLPSLPQLMAEGGGSGITTVAVFQSLAQARNRWGEHAADALWDAATVKVVLGGLAKMRDLEDVSRLLGERDDVTLNVSRGGYGERSTSTSLRRMPVMPPDVLRTLPFGTGVLLLRQARPVVIGLAPWTARRDAEALQAGQRAVEAAAGSAAAAGSPPASGGAPAGTASADRRATG